GGSPESRKLILENRELLIKALTRKYDARLAGVLEERSGKERLSAERVWRTQPQLWLRFLPMIVEMCSLLKPHNPCAG
ncbi:MAG: hypothetical protein WD607_02795, partial [Candidatus Paceibacterota bacterium]